MLSIESITPQLAESKPPGGKSNCPRQRAAHVRVALLDACAAAVSILTRYHPAWHASGCATKRDSSQVETLRMCRTRRSRHNCPGPSSTAPGRRVFRRCPLTNFRRSGSTPRCFVFAKTQRCTQLVPRCPTGLFRRFWSSLLDAALFAHVSRLCEYCVRLCAYYRVPAEGSGWQAVPCGVLASLLIPGSIREQKRGCPTKKPALKRPWCSGAQGHSDTDLASGQSMPGIGLRILETNGCRFPPEFWVQWVFKHQHRRIRIYSAQERLR